MHKLRVSWSILEAWARGDQQAVISRLNGLSWSSNEAMEIGLAAHKVVSQNGILHEEIKPDALYEKVNEAGENSNKFVVELEDWLTLSGIPDIKVPSTKTIIDAKTGNRKSFRHKPMQIYLYAYALEKLGEDYNRGIILKIDRAGLNPLDYTVFKITNAKKQMAENFVYTLATDIYNFLYK